MAETEDIAPTKTVNLKRDLGLSTGCAIIIGSVIGSGIFITPQGVLIGAGSYGLSLIIWVVCGMLSICGALSYAEMGLLIPKSGSAYYYLKEVYGDLVSFIYMFSLIFCILPASTGAVALTFAEYLLALFFTDSCGEAPRIIVKILTVSGILFGCAINVISVNFTGRLSIVFTAAKTGALFVIIFGGILKLSQGYSNYLHPDVSFDGTNTNAAAIAFALVNGMFSYGGWEALNFVVEELKHPSRDLPLAVLISLPTITLVYLLSNISYFAVLSPDEMKESSAVAVTWANYIIPNVYWFVPLAVSMSTFGTQCTVQLTSTRLLFVAARERHLPKIVSMVQVNNFTPVPAIIFFTILTILYTLMGTVIQLIAYASSLAWLFHGMVGVGLLILRVKRKNEIRKYKVPLICPLVLIAFSVFIFLAPIIGNPQWGHLFSILILVVAVIFWIIVVKCNCNIPGTGLLTQYLQLFLQVVSSEEVAYEISREGENSDNGYDDFNDKIINSKASEITKM